MSLLVHKAAALFDNETSDNWESFLELTALKTAIADKWYKQLQDSVKEHFKGESWSDWKYRFYKDRSFCYYLENDGINSLSLWFEDGVLSLWVNEAIYDPAEIVKKYKNSKLFTSWFDSSEIIQSGGYLAKRYNAIKIDGRTDSDYLAWYAASGHGGHNQMVDQVCRYFEHFMSDSELIEIIRKINQEIRPSRA